MKGILLKWEGFRNVLLEITFKTMVIVHELSQLIFWSCLVASFYKFLLETRT